MSSGSNPMPIANEHFVQLYRTEPELTDALASYALDVLDYQRQGLLIFATRRHCDTFRRALMLRELDVGGAMGRGQIRFIHVEDILPKLLRDNEIDQASFETLVTAEFERMRGEGIRHIHVYGEIVDVLWRSGNRPATLRLEQLWNNLRFAHEFTLYCAYMVDQEPMDAVLGVLSEAICTHDALMQEMAVDGIHQRRVFSDLMALARTKLQSAPAPAGAGPRALPN